jgi:hypothetical protein
MAIKKLLTVTGMGYVAFENSYFETGATNC